MHRASTAIIVLGYHQYDSEGRHGISDICRAGVRQAARLAHEVAPRAVVFTGYSSSPDDGPSEAEQMMELWDELEGSKGLVDTRLLLEPRAVDTAENAARSLALLLHDDARVDHVIVVCSIRHLLRAPFFFRSLYRPHGITRAYAIVWRPWPPVRIWIRELGGIARMFHDRRRVRKALAAGEHDPRPFT